MGDVLIADHGEHSAAPGQAGCLSASSQAAVPADLARFARRSGGATGGPGRTGGVQTTPRRGRVCCGGKPRPAVPWCRRDGPRWGARAIAPPSARGIPRIRSRVLPQSPSCRGRGRPVCWSSPRGAKRRRVRATSSACQERVRCPSRRVPVPLPPGSLPRASSRLIRRPGLVGPCGSQCERLIPRCGCSGGRVIAPSARSLRASGACCAAAPRPIVSAPVWRGCVRPGGTIAVISRPCDRRCSR
jgi:hypothetical protein